MIFGSLSCYLRGIVGIGGIVYELLNWVECWIESGGVGEVGKEDNFGKYRKGVKECEVRLLEVRIGSWK